MMRYQRVSPDCVPLTSNGKKPNGISIHQTPPQSTINANNTNNDPIASSSSSFEPNKAFRFRSPSRTPDHHNTSSPNTNNTHFDNNNVHHHIQQPQQHELSPSDMLLQWGHRKRPRASRTEIRALTDDSSSSSSVQVRQQQQQQQQQPVKSQRRHVGPTTTTPASMPPPPPPPPPTTTATIVPSSSNGRVRKETSSSGSLHNRNLEDRHGATNGSSPLRHSSGGNNRVASRSTTTGKRSLPPEKNERKSSSSARAVHEKPNGSSPAMQTVRSNPFESASLLQHHEQEINNNNNNTCSAPKDATVEVLEWPKIQIPLSRKEKEEDFFAMRGLKLPQRPKKRPKNVERALQYVFPGLWLADVTRNRYEVREKKCVKKQKRRGLKGMESVDSDSE